jgi:hypothetical protein
VWPWPSIRGSFALPLDALGALLVTATAGYVASSFSSGWLLARMSVGTPAFRRFSRGRWR